MKRYRISDILRAMIKERYYPALGLGSLRSSSLKKVIQREGGLRQWLKNRNISIAGMFNLGVTQWENLTHEQRVKLLVDEAVRLKVKKRG